MGPRSTLATSGWPFNLAVSSGVRPQGALRNFQKGLFHILHFMVTLMALCSLKHFEGDTQKASTVMSPNTPSPCDKRSHKTPSGRSPQIELQTFDVLGGGVGTSVTFDSRLNPSDDEIGSPAVASGGASGEGVWAPPVESPTLISRPEGGVFGHFQGLTGHVREESWGLLGVLVVAFPGLSKWISLKFGVFPVVKK